MTGVATLVFGACHAAAFGRLSAGRQASARVRVRHETAGWFVPVVIIGSLLLGGPRLMAAIRRRAARPARVL